MARAAGIDVTLEVWDGMIHALPDVRRGASRGVSGYRIDRRISQPAPSHQGLEGTIMNVRPADPRSHSDSEFHFSEQPQLSEELRMLREQVRRFVEKEVVPHGEQWSATQDPARDFIAYGRARLSRHAPRGRIWRYRYGPLASMVWAEELGRSTFGGFTSSCWFIPTCRLFTSPARHTGAKQKYLPAIIPRRDDLLDRGD